MCIISCMAVSVTSNSLEQKLESDQRILEKMEGFPESYSTETSRLRQIKLQHENDLMEAEVVGEKLEREIERYYNYVYAQQGPIAIHRVTCTVYMYLFLHHTFACTV